MALIVDFICKRCGYKGTTAIGSGKSAPDLCGKCAEERKDIERREHFAGLDGLTTEERLRKIEEWIYSYRPPININDIRF